MYMALLRKAIEILLLVDPRAGPGQLGAPHPLHFLRMLSHINDKSYVLDRAMCCETIKRLYMTEPN